MQRLGLVELFRTMLALAVGVLVPMVSSCDVGHAPTTYPMTVEEDFGPPPAKKSRLELVTKLGRKPNFLIGHGNDLPGPEKDYDVAQALIFTLPVSLDIHYVYLSGLVDEPGPEGPGWPDYEPDGAFVTKVAENAALHEVTPMFTLYQAAARGERRMDVLGENDFMKKYWSGVRRLFERLGDFGQPALVHIEPDFWGFAQQFSLQTRQPTDVRALVGSVVSECEDLPDDVGGMGRCIIRLARAIAPKVSIGLHASGFGAAGSPKRVARYLDACGAREGDFIVVDVLDRDAGCFEAGTDPLCQRSSHGLYWDETTFRDHLDWASTIHERLGLPVLWWQVPLGVPSDRPGGTPKHYRDNRVRYFFDHVDALESAGGFGAAFGVGAPNQTDVTTDGGQFASAALRYRSTPFALASP